MSFNSLFSIQIVKGNAQFVQKVTFEPLMDFKQNHCGSWKYYKKLLLLKVFFIHALRTLFHIEGAQIFQKGATSRPFEAT